MLTNSRQLVSVTAGEFESFRTKQDVQSVDISESLTVIKRVDSRLESTQSKLIVIEQSQQTTARREFLDWICSSFDTSVRFNDAIKLREPGTGGWFLDSASFAQWLNSKDLIWLTGIPGCGKTILCSTSIEAIQNVCYQSPDRRLAYFFFDFQNTWTQNLDNMLRSLIRQLSGPESDVPEFVRSMYSSCRDKGQSPSTEQLCSAFIATVRTSSKDSYILVDALDEVPEVGRHEVLRFFQRAMNENLPNLHILLTSRDEDDIRAALTAVSPLIVRLKQQEVDADIKVYVRKCLEDPGGGLSELSTGLKTEIETTIGNEADGMFRLAFCQLEIIKQCRKPRDIKEALRRLPRTLYDTYARILSQIDDRDYRDAFSILQWLAFSRRSLTLEEVAEAAFLRPQKDTFDPDERLLQARQVLRICHSLVTLSAENKQDAYADSTSAAPRALNEQDKRADLSVVQFAHFSVLEYLLSGESGKFTIAPSPSHAWIGGSCISYILHIEQVEPVDLGEFTLFPYAAQFWHEHICSIEKPTSEVWDLVYRILDPKNFAKRAYRWLQIYEPTTQSSLDYVESSIELPGPLYYSALFGFVDTIRRLLDSGVKVNELHHFRPKRARPIFSLGSFQASACTALEIAAFQGHIDSVDLLLSYGADCNTRGSHGSVLQRTLEGHRNHAASTTTQIVHRLLEIGADVKSAENNRWDAPILIAGEAGLLSVVQDLIRRGADTTLFPGALWRAAQKDHEQISYLLIDKAANSSTYELLRVAITSGNQNIFQYVLRRHTISEIGAHLRRDLVELAACEGNESIFRHLIRLYNHSRPQELPSVIEDALVGAVRNGHVDIVQSLLCPTAEEIGNSLSLERTKSLALYAAIEHRESDILRLAIREGADINATEPCPNVWYKGPLTPIQSATVRSFRDGVETLLHSGVCIESHNSDDILMPAVLQDNSEILGMLLQKVLHTGLPSAKMTPLLLGILDVNIAEMLLEAGIDPNAVGEFPDVYHDSKEIRTALHHAIAHGEVSMVRLFLRFGADVNTGALPTIALNTSHHRKPITIVNMLLKHDATICQRIFPLVDTWTKVELIESLVEAGVNIDIVDGKGQMMLLDAWESDNVDVFKWLLKRGADAEKLCEQQPHIRARIERYIRSDGREDLNLNEFSDYAYPESPTEGISPFDEDLDVVDIA